MAVGLEPPRGFRDLEWQVARVRRALELHPEREAETLGKGDALVTSALEALNAAVKRFAKEIP